MINIIQGIYDIISNKAFRRDGYLHKETQELLSSLPNRFKDLLFKRGVKFFWKYGFIECYFTLGRDVKNNIEVIAICHPFKDIFNEELGESIVIGRIKRMRGDLKYETRKPKKDKHGEVILDENKKQIIEYRLKYYKPYDLDAKILDKNGNETKKLKYPYISVNLKGKKL